MGSKYTKLDKSVDSAVQCVSPGKNNQLESVRDFLPDELVKCVKMCLGNIVTSDFFTATFEWAKRELEGCNSTEAEAVSRIAVKALRAQVFKGADSDELELMQIAVMDVIVDLNNASEFPSCEELLNDIEELSASGLSEQYASEAAATVIVDALAAAYWDSAIKLVDVLIEVVGKKKEQEYQEAVRVWMSGVDKAKADLTHAEEEIRQAELVFTGLKDNLRKIKAEIEKAQLDDELKRQDEALLTEVKQAEVQLTETELALAEDQGKKEANELRLSQQRQELAGLGMFAFSKKKALRHEIEDLEDRVREVGNSIELREGMIRSLKQKVEQRSELECRLAAYPESRTHELESNVRDAKFELDQACKQVKEAEGVKSESENRLQMRYEERPKMSDYSSEPIKRALRWRPTTSSVSVIAPTGGTSNSAGIRHSDGYRKGSGGTWRDRRLTCFDAGLRISLNRNASSGPSDSGYRSVFDLNVEPVDSAMTHRVDIDIEGPSSAFDAANAFLSEAADSFRRKDFVGKFDFLSGLECTRLPFTSIDTRLYVPEIDLDEINAAITLIGALNKECPQLRLDGVIEMVRSFAGRRNIIYIKSDAGDPTMTIEQEYESLS